MQLETYLTFAGCCEEALRFYEEALGAEITTLMHFRDSPDSTMAEAGDPDKVMHAVLRIGDSTLMASDGQCTGDSHFAGFSLSLSLSGEAEARHCFAALSRGGEVTMKLTPTFWSPLFGMVTDRFGVSWMLNVLA